MCKHKYFFNCSVEYLLPTFLVFGRFVLRPSDLVVYPTKPPPQQVVNQGTYTLWPWLYTFLINVTVLVVGLSLRKPVTDHAHFRYYNEMGDSNPV